MIIESENVVEWLPESRAVPENAQLWSQAKRIARMDKKQSEFVSRMLSKRIYQMMGGIFKQPGVKGNKK
jgi:hypothetical protein